MRVDCPQDSPVLLLTGFEPFEQWDVNPSLEIARALDCFQAAGARVVAGELPVNWAEAWPRLDALIDTHSPRWVLMLGLAGRRDHISVEARGRNVASARPDNSGLLPPEPEIVPGGKDYLGSTLPVDEIVEAIAAIGVPVERSEDPGGYLCNFALYRALAWALTRDAPPEIAFIHVPVIALGEGQPVGLPLEQMVEAVRAAIKTAVAPRSAAHT